MATRDSQSPDPNGTDASQQAHVRVLGTRLGRFVEFEYSLGDGTLAVELILPTKAFEEFCRTRGADVTTVDTQTAEAVEQMAWRAGHPGLLQRTARDAASAPHTHHQREPGPANEPTGGKR